MEKVRSVIIGSGLIAGKKHIPAFRRLRSKTELVAICDLNLAAAKEVAARFGIPRTYSDVGEMLKAEKPDLVDICTPPQTHTRLSLEAMQKLRPCPGREADGTYSRRLRSNRASLERIWPSSMRRTQRFVL